MDIEVTRDGPVVTVTLNRPEKLNAMTVEMYAAVTQAFIDIDRDDEARVGIITGVGTRAFSAGADLIRMHASGEGGGGWRAFRADRFDHGLECGKPLIAAINGYCLAGGLELALACDIRIAAEHARFGCPEVKWGILHGYGAVRLPQMIPTSTAMEMLLTGEFIDASRALQVGLVSKVVPQDDLLATASQIAAAIARNGPMAVRMTKELALRGADLPIEQGLRLYQEYSRAAHNSDEAREGTAAFAERRDPKYAAP